VSIDIVARNEDKFSGLIVENTFLSLVSYEPTLPLILSLFFLTGGVLLAVGVIRTLIFFILLLVVSMICARKQLIFRACLPISPPAM